ncbi:MAG: hypothetical protein JNK76_03530, partial [Planctomycetales bacterium]|nr:hypothetical protein [Planctomycetales bacterium]
MTVYADGEVLERTSVVRIVRSTGGATGDVCILRTLDETAPEKLVSQLTVQTIVVVEEYETDEPIFGDEGEVPLAPSAVTYETRKEVVFWGQTSGAAVDLDRGSVEFEARIGRHHFGKPLEGMLEYEREGPNSYYQSIRPVDVVFNPEIDGRTRGNMDPEARHLGYAFLDYERVRTRAAREKQRIEPFDDEEFREKEEERLWTLPDAVNALCYRLNDPEEDPFIENPSFEEVFKTLPEDKELLRGVRLKLGWYLNECLNQLLHPFGYTWSVQPPTDVEGKPRIVIHERAKGPEVELQLQSLGEVIDPDRTNIGGGSFASGRQTLVNQVRVLGDFKRFHVTLYLMPAWSSELDDLDEEDLRKDSTSYQENPERQRVGRDWVFNEAQDYHDSREGHKAGELDPYFERENGTKIMPRRRRVFPGIVRRPDGVPIGEDGIVLQIQLADGDEWITPDNQNDFGAWAVLDQEIGIRFTGNHVPSELWAAFQDGDKTPLGWPKVRVTGVIVDDKRLEYTAERRETSPQKEVIEELIDAGERFQFRKLSEFSIHYEDRESLDVDEQDDTEAIEKFAERLRDAWDQADVSGKFEIIGLGGQKLELGMVVTSVYGREIALEAHGEG